jgi:hypothetical protein
MKTVAPNEVNVTQLEDDCKRAEGMEISYALYRVQTTNQVYYAIEIHTERETEMQILGCQCDRARLIYETLTREMATPCTLCDIVHDMREEEKLLAYH